MGWFNLDPDVPVELEGCRCPGTPHDHDTVWLAAEITPDGGIAAMSVIERGAPDAATMEGLLGRAYVQHNITRWTLVDEKGADVQPTPWLISRLSYDAIKPIAEKANELYSEKLLRPLVERLSKSSQRGQTDESTSAKPDTSTKRRKRSKQSTTATTTPNPEPSMSSE